MKYLLILLAGLFIAGCCSTPQENKVSETDVKIQQLEKRIDQLEKRVDELHPGGYLPLK